MSTHTLVPQTVRSRRTARTVAVVIAAALGGTLAARASSGTAPAQSAQVAPLPAAIVEMRHHFVEVTRLHEAVIRGDLPEARSAAAAIATLELPPGFPIAGARFVGVLRTEARRAAAAPDLATAASATAAMVAQCGACHVRAVRPPIASPTVRDLGGIVAHMREHQRAVDELLQGLIVPSAQLWRQGAERLRAEPLETSRLPPDPALNPRIAEAETRVHRLAERALQANELPARTAAYADLLTTCAECHSLHGRVWGPRSTTSGAGS